ncbi:unnamed protein product [Urochloa humidicola]
MVGGARRRSCGCGNVSGRRVRRVRAHGGRKLGDGGGTGMMSGGGGKMLDARGVQIEGRQDRIEGGGGCILVVPDSEDEGPNLEMANMAAEGKAAVMVPAAPTLAVAVTPGMGPNAAVAVGGAPGMEVATDGAPVMELAADGAQGMELAPEVQERLKVVLAGIDPVYHAFYISLYKLQLRTLWCSFCARELLLHVTGPLQLFCGHYSWAFVS